MIDYKKRNTLKAIVGTSAAVAAGGVMATVPSSTQLNDEILHDLASVGQELGQLEVSTRISVIRNDLEVVLLNAGNEPLTITHMTPGTASVARGDFNFSELLKNGPLRLEAGKSAVVPLQRKQVSMSTARTTSLLNDVLEKSLSVITDADSFCCVSIVKNTSVAV